jgi:hypothetical protein
MGALGLSLSGIKIRKPHTHPFERDRFDLKDARREDAERVVVYSIFVGTLKSVMLEKIWTVLLLG